MEPKEWTRERTVLCVMVGLFILSLGYLVFADSGLIKVWHLGSQVSALNDEIATLHGENNKLAREIEQLRGDDARITREIRERLGMVEPGETVFVFDAHVNTAQR